MPRRASPGRAADQPPHLGDELFAGRIARGADRAPVFRDGCGQLLVVQGDELLGLVHVHHRRRDLACADRRDQRPGPSGPLREQLDRLGLGVGGDSLEYDASTTEATSGSSSRPSAASNWPANSGERLVSASARRRWSAASRRRPRSSAASARSRSAGSRPLVLNARRHVLDAAGVFPGDGEQCRVEADGMRLRISQQRRQRRLERRAELLELLALELARLNSCGQQLQALLGRLAEAGRAQRRTARRPAAAQTCDCGQNPFHGAGNDRFERAAPKSLGCWATAYTNVAASGLPATDADSARRCGESACLSPHLAQHIDARHGYQPDAIDLLAASQ